MRKIDFNENHLRVLSVVLRHIEKVMEDMIYALNKKNKGITYEIIVDYDEKDIKEKLKVIEEVKQQIEGMFTEYNLKKEITTLNRTIESKKNHIWEVLQDSYIIGLKKYGNIDNEHSETFDSEIDKMLMIIERI